jgi:hypothetical protein
MDGGEQPRHVLVSNPYDKDPVRRYASYDDFFRDMQRHGPSPYRRELLEFGWSMEGQDEVRERHLRAKDLIEAQNELEVFLMGEGEVDDGQFDYA